VGVTDKPRHRSGYTSEETEVVRSACLTFAVTCGSYLDDLCIVGGLVPSLLINPADIQDDEVEPHPGTNDLDVGLAVLLLDSERYATMSERLRQEGFEPATNANGNRTVQTWRWRGTRTKIDFLMPAIEEQRPETIKHLERDFGALLTPGLEVAFDERIEVYMVGRTLMGESVTRSVPVCGPGAFTVLKSFALHLRGEPKDAYDLVYVLRHTPGRHETVAPILASHHDRHPRVVSKAIAELEASFSSIDSVGPRRAAEFDTIDPTDFDDNAADARGFVLDLVAEFRRLVG
jgi:hypothetical protein